jgi:pilus assembly protein Flp/PilA
MKRFKPTFIAIRKNQKGLTTVEYALAGGLIAVAVATAFTNLGTEVAAVINNLILIITPGA